MIMIISNHEFKKYFLNKLIINKKKSMKLKININLEDNYLNKYFIYFG